MHHLHADGYRAFCAYVAKTKTLDYRSIVAHVMKASGGSCDPNAVVDWIDQWVMMCEALYLHRGIPLPEPIAAGVGLGVETGKLKDPL